MTLVKKPIATGAAWMAGECRMPWVRRSALANKIAAKLEKDKMAFMYGLCRVGKTSLVIEAYETMTGKDILNRGAHSPPAGDIDIHTIEDIARLQLNDSHLGYYEKARAAVKKGIAKILCIDECAMLSSKTSYSIYADVPKKVREVTEIAKKEGIPIVLIFHKGPDMGYVAKVGDMLSMDVDRNALIPIPAIVPATEVKRALTEPYEQMKVKLSGEAIRYILENGGRYVHILSEMLNELFNRTFAYELENRTKQTIKAKDTNNLWRYELEYRNFFLHNRNSFSEAEQKSLDILWNPKLGISALPESGHGEALMELKKLGLVEIRGGKCTVIPSPSSQYLEWKWPHMPA